jgi:hypothetical protein
MPIFSAQVVASRPFLAHKQWHRIQEPKTHECLEESHKGKNNNKQKAYNITQQQHNPKTQQQNNFNRQNHGDASRENPLCVFPAS